MSGGFKFNGVDIAEFKLEYIPNTSNMYVYGDSFKVSQQARTGADGGYFYGTQVPPKEFSLYCVLQDTAQFNIDKIRQFFKRGTAGTLVFDRRPHLKYNVRVTGFKFQPMVALRCGYVTIQMTAYYPYSTAQSLYYPFNMRLQQDQLNHYVYMDQLINTTTAILNQERTPATSFTLTNRTSAITYLLYNGGTERAAVNIKVKGNVGDGLTIYNSATHQYCDIKAVPASKISGDKYISLNAYDGKTSIIDGTNATLAFLYHDRDYINLQPAYPIIRDAHIYMVKGTNKVVSQNVEFEAEDVGKYIYIQDGANQTVQGKWRKIISVGDGYCVVNFTASKNISCYSEIVTMNQITITPLSNFSGTIQFDYLPTFD